MEDHYAKLSPDDKTMVDIRAYADYKDQLRKPGGLGGIEQKEWLDNRRRMLSSPTLLPFLRKQKALGTGAFRAQPEDE